MELKQIQSFSQFPEQMCTRSTHNSVQNFFEPPFLVVVFSCKFLISCTTLKKAFSALCFVFALVSKNGHPFISLSAISLPLLSDTSRSSFKSDLFPARTQ